jgi:type VI protein secretion system component VasK
MCAKRPQLLAPVQQDIEGQLVDLTQMATAQVDEQVNRLARDGHATLKTYLMMADPSRADAAFMTPQLVRHWNGGIGLSPGEKLGPVAAAAGVLRAAPRRASRLAHRRARRARRGRPRPCSP